MLSAIICRFINASFVRRMLKVRCGPWMKMNIGKDGRRKFLGNSFYIIKYGFKVDCHGKQSM